MITGIAILISEETSIYKVGVEGVAKIEGDDKFILGDPFDYYFVYNNEGKLLAEIDARLPLEIRHTPE